jgi:hypothetical protein
MKHLWEIEHPYYCCQTEFRHEHFDSWSDFLEDWRESDLDLNLVFRWDWVHQKEPVDPDYEHNVVTFYMVHQRKGRTASVSVQVTEADEPAVIEWLKPRAALIRTLWEGME